MKLHEKISVYRKKCGLSQETLAEKIGVSRQAVSKWETGDALPEINKLKSLAECFGVTVDFLLDDEADEYQQPNVETNQVKANTFDRIVAWFESFFEKRSPSLQKYSFLVGVFFILAGIYIIAKGSILLLSVGFMASNSMSIVAIPMLLLPIAYMLIGVLIVVVGAILVKKLMKK